MSSAIDVVETRINALLTENTENLQESEAKLLRFRTELLIHAHNKNFKPTSLLFELFAFSYKLRDFSDNEDSKTKLRQQFDSLLKVLCVSDSEAKEVDTAVYFYKHGATSELLTFLCATGSDLSQKVNIDGTSFTYPIHVAVKCGQLEVVKWMLLNGTKLDFQASDGSTCLHEAVRSVKDTEETSSVIFEILLKAVSEQGASKTHILDMEDHSGCTVLDLTKGSGRSKEQDMLRAAGAHENSKTLALRHQVVSDIEKNDHQHLEKVLGEHPELCDGTILSDGMTLLHLAVKQRSLDCANLLLCACTTPKELANTKDSLGWSSLHFSVAAGDLNITTLLLQHGADADTLSRDGCGRVNPRIEAGLKKYSFDLSPSPKEEKNGRWRPLHIASIIGSEAIARLLVESGAQLHPLDLEGLTPMRRAILLKYPAIVQLILESSDTSTTGSVGSTDTPSSRKMQPSQGALTDAVVMENDEIVNLLLDHGWNVNEQSAQTGWTALSQAVVLQNEKLVTRLLQKGADPSILHGDRSSLIHLAAEGKNIQLVRALLPRCSALVTDQYGATALHAAAKKGFSPTAKLLLKSGIDIDAVDQERKSALYIALESSNLPVAQFLLDNGASTQSFGGPQKTLMHAAVRSGNPWALKLVLSQKGMKDVPLDSTDENGDTLLCIAAKGGHAKMVQELMRLHRPRNLWRPILATLFKMAEIGNDAMLKVIIHHDKRFVSALNEDAGAVKIANVDGIGAVSKSSWTVLHAAVWYAQPSSAELLLVEGANIHAEAAGLTPLGLLCVTPNGQLQDAHLRVFAILLKNRADVLRGGLGHTALHLAAKAGHINLVERILSSGADLSATNGHGQTALQCAADSGHAEMVSHLVLKGAILDPICLHTAVHSGRSHTVEMLTDMGIDVNCVGPDGFTPLLVAAATGRVEMVNRLLEHGADIQFRSTNRKQSALDMAVASGQLGSVTALLDSPSYGKAFRADHGYAWTAASKDSSAGGKIYKYIFERTDCQKDHGAAILHWAIINDNELLLHLLINNGVDLKTPNLDGWGALHAATMAGKLDMMKLILSKGVGVNYQGHKSRTALHQAIAADQAAAYTFLMQNGADNSILDEDSQGCIRLALDYSATEVLAVLNLQPYHFTGNSYDGKTLVALAAESDNGSIISCLLKIEAGFSAEHTTSFAQAVSSGDELLVRRLLVFGAELNRKDFRGVSPLREAVTKQNQGIAELLLDSGADVESKCSLGMTPLAFAAKNNDSTMAALLIRYGANVNATETKNECPILVAVAWRGHLEVARLLLQHGCDVQCRTSGGSTALHQATTENHVELIKVLVQAGIQVDIKDGEGHSPLYLATEHHSDTAAAESLLHLGASTELKSASGYTPLMNATIKNQVALMRTLIEFGADINNPDEAGRVPIMVAVAAGSQPCIALLKDHGARLDLLDKSGHSLLHYVAESGNMDVIKTFIGNGLDINSATDKNGATLLHRAAGAGRLDLVKSLLDAGAILQSKTIDGETVLMTACCGSENANVELARYLIEAGQDVNAIGTGTRRTPLTNAVLAGNMEMTKMLIQKGANVKLSASGGQSLLHEAAASGSVALLDLLVSHGLSLNTVGNGPVRESVLFTAADSGQEEAVLAIAVQTPELIDKANASGETPLQRAVVKQHLGVVKLLCDLGAMVHQIKHDTRETLMHLASKTGKAASTGELIKYLSECGVSIYSPTNDGITPLMMAVMHEAAEAVAAILDCGAKVDEFDFVGGRRRVLDVAVRGGMCSMVQLLVSRGASLTFLDERGNPILDTAVTSNNAAIVKSILQGEQANFNINGISSDDGFGPLHKAAARNNGEVVSLLLEYGMFMMDLMKLFLFVNKTTQAPEATCAPEMAGRRFNSQRVSAMLMRRRPCTSPARSLIPTFAIATATRP